MKIAHVQLLPLMTGVQKVSIDELVRLDNDKYKKFVICKEEGKLTEICEKNNIGVAFAPSLIREIHPISDLKSFFELYKVFKKEKFDIVHTHSAKTGLLGKLAAKAAGVPLIVHTVHGYPFPAAKSKFSKALYFLLEYLGAKLCDITICLHDDDANIAINKLKTSRSKVRVIPNGVDTEQYKPVEAVNKAKTDIKSIGMVGRLWEQKDPVTLVKAAILLAQERKDFVVNIVGGGELQSQLEELISNAQAQEQIKLLGWRSDVAELLPHFDIFVLPSRWEGMPLAILEAQSCQVPCVVTNIQGNNYLVNDDYDGKLFEVEDAEGLKKVLAELLDNPEQLKRLGKNARAKIEADYDIRNRVNIIEALYTEQLRK
ncbi:glycosyltransferase family 1 protein [Pseudoalteromonas phenolica]|uniref:Glycosyltransferase family 1 protein n=1 Tax=Pseudoalteromonas phenolica TaxID=161398 RepID=A0A5S3YY81_9GAMM|nr:glycosyltransferase family 4 protein [Pseudoalteromonas phenolica]TMP83641.1 glycosyltransferase family 1 protein [Pseudoalteromonas phenolica]